MQTYKDVHVTLMTINDDGNNIIMKMEMNGAMEIQRCLDLIS